MLEDVAGGLCPALRQGCLELFSGGPDGARRGGRGLHSSTFQLNLSACCVTGVHLGGVDGVFRRCQGI